MVGVVTNIGIDYPDSGSRRSKYVEITWTSGSVDIIHLCYGNWDNISVVG